jgi:hypothetical protein
MHGGAPGSGAPKGNSNAFKHGRHTREAHCRTPAGKGVAQAVACSAPEDWVSDRWSCGTGRQVLHAVELHAVSSIDPRSAGFRLLLCCRHLAVRSSCDRATLLDQLCYTLLWRSWSNHQAFRLQLLGRDRSLNGCGR